MKKSDSKFHTSAGVSKPRKKHKALTPAQPRELRNRGWMVCGFDTSMSSLAGAAIGYDRALDKFVGPKFAMLRWAKEDDYFDRLRESAMSYELVQGLQADLGLMLNIEEIFIAQEEPWPLGMIRGGLSSYLKQQAEISGAFLGGLVRYGYANVFQINSIHWRKMIADDLGITTHHSKWKDPKLAAQYNCKPADSGKFRAKQWAFDVSQKSSYTQFHKAGFKDEIPDWPDIIKTKDGNTPRPEGSVAKAIQPDDRYDALAVMWHLAMVELHGELDKSA